MSSMVVSLEAESSHGNREPLPVCHEGGIKRVSPGIQLREDLGITIRFACRTSFTSPRRSSDRDAIDQTP